MTEHSRYGDKAIRLVRLARSQVEHAQHLIGELERPRPLEPGWVPDPRYADPAFRITFARIVTHFFHHAAWLIDGQLIADAHCLSRIPGVLVHGRLDLGNPADAAWQLAQAWPEAELHYLDAGHGTSDQATTRIVEATNRFATRP